MTSPSLGGNTYETKEDGMSENFGTNFANIMMQAGYEEINMPAHFSYPVNITMWCKFAGSMAYYYVLYDLSSADFSAFASLKAHIDQGIAAISGRNDMRHSVVFNIFTRISGENMQYTEQIVNSGGEFALLPKYDVYYALDASTSQIMRNTKQPANVDGALDKIKAVLEICKKTADGDEKMFHVEHSVSSPYATPVAKYPILFCVILAVNLLLFALMELGGGSTDIATLLRFGAASRHHIFTLGEYHRLVTPIFLHIGVGHLLFNTMSLILFGIRTERYFGHFKFLAIYMVSGIAGNLAMVLANPFAMGAGASGAIFGVMGALFAFTKVRKKNVESFNAGALAVMIAVGVLMGFTMAGVPGMPNVANMAHIGGLVTGFAMGVLLSGKNKQAKS